MLAKFMNVEIKNVRMYVANEGKVEELTYVENSAKTMIDINEMYWRSAADVQVFDMKEILSALD